MQQPPLISVIIPTFNRAGLLLETLKTVLAQTLTDYEIIIVNDGSTDDTLQRLEPLRKERGDRFRIITTQNQGVGAARNHGIDEARGDYVAMLDHDDLWMPGKLAAQIEFLKSQPECCGVTVPFGLSDSPQKPQFDVSAVADSNGIIENPLRRLAGNHSFMTTSSTLMFERKRAEGLRYGTHRGATEDVHFFVNLFARGGFGVAGREILAIYRVHPGGQSQSAGYYFRGMRELRRADAAGDFAAFTGPRRADLDAYLANLGRIAAMQQLTGRARLDGARLYLSEFGHQLRQGRARFLLFYPAFLLIPRKIRKCLG